MKKKIYEKAFNLQTTINYFEEYKQTIENIGEPFTVSFSHLSFPPIVVPTSFLPVNLKEQVLNKINEELYRLKKEFEEL